MNAHDKAWEYFENYYPFLKDLRKRVRLVLHHIDQNWKKSDPKRYYQWNPEDLVVMTNRHHSRFHGLYPHSWRKGFLRGKQNINYQNALGFNGPTHPFYGKKHSQELKNRFSLKYSGSGNPMYGKSSWEKCTPEQRADRAHRYSESMKGKNKGKHFFTDGINNVFRFECPPGYRPGITQHKASKTRKNISRQAEPETSQNKENPINAKPKNN